MKRFVFRLETYLSFCRHVEEAEQMRLAEAMSELGRAQESLRSIEGALDRTETEFAGQRQILVYEAGWYLHRIASLKSESDRISFQIQQLTQTVRRRRDRLVEARRNRKIVERLRQRRLENHELEVSRADQAEMDDLFLQKFSRS